MLDENMSNLNPKDLKTSEKHRALWNCQICGREFTSAIKLVVDHGDGLCKSCRQRKHMKDLKERNRRKSSASRGSRRKTGKTREDKARTSGRIKET